MGQIDVQHAVDDGRAGDLDMVGEAEMPLESATRDPAVQITAFVLVLFCLAGHDHRVLLNRDVEFVGREPGHCHRQPVGIFTGLFDIVRW